MFLNPGGLILAHFDQANEKQAMEIRENKLQSHVSQKRQNFQTTQIEIQEFPSI